MGKAKEAFELMASGNSGKIILTLDWRENNEEGDGSKQERFTDGSYWQGIGLKAD